MASSRSVCLCSRVHALQKLLASHSWTGPQRDWLKKIATQTKANLLVDHTAFDDPDLIFKREGGGFTRLDKMFNGELQQVLETFNESIGQQTALDFSWQKA